MLCAKRFITLSLLGLLPLLGGCGKMPLYTNVPERQANEIISLLRARNMSTGKVTGAEGTWTVTIAPNQFATAVDILSNYGYPKDQFNTIGKVFQKSGLVSSPTEERARFMYALSENLAENISHVSGVVTARVNIVLPENNPYTTATSPSSAAVFVAYRTGSNIEDSIRDIKLLVANSIEGLSNDKVSVALFPTPLLSDEMLPDAQLVSVLSIRMTRASLWAFWGLLLVVGAAAAAAGGVAAKVLLDYLAVRREEKQKAKGSEEKVTENAVEEAKNEEEEEIEEELAPAEKKKEDSESKPPEGDFSDEED
ncbi:MAG: type III secretion inner membrane ring lipoprotein SctJ [Puniceicoccales bacterium]|jgi:type III secretion protein J|nr:type III secretion inner membrane ring lipoprotein SctJ [Puniceicoccales bacterium]